MSVRHNSSQRIWRIITFSMKDVFMQAFHIISKTDTVIHWISLKLQLSPRLWTKAVDRWCLKSLKYLKRRFCWWKKLWNQSVRNIFLSICTWSEKEYNTSWLETKTIKYIPLWSRSSAPRHLKSRKWAQNGAEWESKTENR